MMTLLDLCRRRSWRRRSSMLVLLDCFLRISFALSASFIVSTVSLSCAPDVMGH